jgi:3-oxoacyl-[acyl-carrier protein] reductase
MLPAMTLQASTDPVTAVVAGDAGFGTALVERLARRNHGPATLLPVADAPADATAALEAVGDLAAVVHVCGDDAALEPASLAATDAAAWDAGCERMLWRALCTLQAAHAAFSGRGGGRVVVVTAAIAVSGAPHWAPLLAAVEGTRAMAKSAARQWGAVNISVNCVAVPLELLAPAPTDTPSFVPPAAQSRVDPIDDVAGAIEFLAGPGARGISGATLLVDGGAVMAP